ncbi:MAG: AAA family ATPase [bacterium]
MKTVNFKFDWPLVGNAHIIEFLEKGILNDKVNGAYIFNGPNDLGKTTLANYFAECLLYYKCQEEKKATSLGLHGDFHLIKKEEDKKNISISQIRELINKLSVSSFSGGAKIAIIKDAESMNTEAANALLKTLEEPRKNVVIILLSNDQDSLLPTIVSRCQVLNFRPVRQEIIYDFLISKDASRAEAKRYSEMCLGRPALALKFLEDESFRDDYEKIINTFLSFPRVGLNERFSMIEDLVGKKSAGQATVDIAGKVLEIWLAAARVAFLSKFNYNLSENNATESAFRKASARDLLCLIKEIVKGKEYLNANVNPRLALENIAITF